MHAGRAPTPLVRVGPRSPPSIELLYVDGCPRVDALRQRLRGLLAVLDIATHVVLTEVVNDEHAQRHRFLGSPTLRKDGVDVDPMASGHSGHGLPHRLQASCSGRRNTPDEAWIGEALRGRS